MATNSSSLSSCCVNRQTHPPSFAKEPCQQLSASNNQAMVFCETADLKLGMKFSDANKESQQIYHPDAVLLECCIGYPAQDGDMNRSFASNACLFSILSYFQHFQMDSRQLSVMFWQCHQNVSFITIRNLRNNLFFWHYYLTRLLAHFLQHDLRYLHLFRS